MRPRVDFRREIDRTASVHRACDARLKTPTSHKRRIAMSSRQGGVVAVLRALKGDVAGVRPPLRLLAAGPQYAAKDSRKADVTFSAESSFVASQR
eukprot:COSAG02_NODE_3438_length_6743_cov_12.416616_2_plen_95_part_00